MSSLSKQSAQQFLEAYARQFGEAHIVLAMHAALPLGLTPEILHLIRINFVNNAPWISEADLLLSQLCREAGDEMYQMKSDVREGLLSELKLDKDFGQRRVREIAEFLYAYTERELTRTYSNVRKDFLQAQQLAAIAFLEPERAAQTIALELQKAQHSHNSAEIQRLSKLTDQLAEPLLGEDDLLLYVAGVNHLESGNDPLARETFALLGNSNIKVGSVELALPSIPEQRTENREQRRKEERESGRTGETSQQARSEQQDVVAPGDSNVAPDSNLGGAEAQETASQSVHYENDIYISFHENDEAIALNDSDDGPVLMFHEDLDSCIGSVMRLSANILISNTNKLEVNLSTELPDTAILLIIYSQNWLGSEPAQQELNVFLEANRAKGIREGAIRNRIILLPLEPIDLSELPTELRHCAQLPLHLEDPAAPPSIAHRESTGEVLDRYRKTMNDLLQMLESQFRTLQNKVLPPDNYLNIDNIRNIWLSDAAYDLAEYYDQLVFQLRQQNYTVLPEEPLGLDGQSSLARFFIMQNCLASADLAIQFVGLNSRDLDIDTVSSTIFDNNLAASISRSAGLKRLIWAPYEVEPDLGENPDSYYGAEVVRGNFDELMSAIQSSLPDFNPESARGKKLEGTETAGFIPRPNSIYFSYYGNRYDEEWLPLHERLVEQFGEAAISGKESTASSKSVEAGFQAAIEKSDIVLAMIGPYWLRRVQNATSVNTDDYGDWLLYELEEAVKQNKYIIPVLYGGARIPAVGELRKSIQRLAELQPLQIDGENAERDIDKAIAFIGGYLGSMQEDFSSSSSTETPIPQNRIAIAYRERNSGEMARRLHEALPEQMPQTRVNIYLDDPPIGQTFASHVETMLETSSVVLVLIDNWFDEFTNSDGDRLIDKPDDELRLKIEIAMRLDIPIIPVLVNNADMPPGDELPESIYTLTERQAIRMSNEYFEDDLAALVQTLNDRLGERESGRAGEASSEAQDVAPGYNPGGSETPDGTKNIFLAMDTSTDMVPAYASVIKTIEGSGHKRIEVEDRGSTTIDTYFEDLKRTLADTDLFVLVIGEALPKLSGRDRSMLEEQYEIARNMNVPLRVFLPTPQAEVKAARGSDIDRMQNFLAQLRGENPISYYESPDDIGRDLQEILEIEFGPTKTNAEPPVEAAENIPQQQTVEADETETNSFSHPITGAEFILIPGGSYTYSVTKSTVRTQDRWFARYPVTNAQYKRFLAHLNGSDEEVESVLPLKLFKDRLNEFAQRVDGLAEYLYGAYNKLGERLRPEQLERLTDFNYEHHPVIGVSWFAARIYCFWLSMIENQNLNNAAEIYSLPSEQEWEWAASGGERTWPWPDSVEGPTEELANFDNYIGSTTPVGRYPKGATPEGLMDMAGNVWEWSANRFSSQNDNRALRGGAFYDDTNLLRCNARNNDAPHKSNTSFGFRVVRREPNNSNKS
ncbi:MAG: SUMF1/EgtB/PvdO family nonheme iron enzyme [Calditrichia bacterium]